MDYEWDEAKRRSNQAKHGVDFALAATEFDWSTAMILEDARRPYGEQRWLALGLIGLRMHTVIFTERDGRKRIISVRKSKRKEIAVYEKASDLPGA